MTPSAQLMSGAERKIIDPRCDKGLWNIVRKQRSLVLQVIRVLGKIPIASVDSTDADVHCVGVSQVFGPGVVDIERQAVVETLAEVQFQSVIAALPEFSQIGGDRLILREGPESLNH